jgi:hypothetical protein
LTRRDLPLAMMRSLISRALGVRVGVWVEFMLQFPFMVDDRLGRGLYSEIEVGSSAFFRNFMPVDKNATPASRGRMFGDQMAGSSALSSISASICGVGLPASLSWPRTRLGVVSCDLQELVKEIVAATCSTVMPFASELCWGVQRHWHATDNADADCPTWPTCKKFVAAHGIRLSSERREVRACRVSRAFGLAEASRCSAPSRPTAANSAIPTSKPA